MTVGVQFRGSFCHHYWTGPAAAMSPASAFMMESDAASTETESTEAGDDGVWLMSQDAGPCSYRRDISRHHDLYRTLLLQSKFCHKTRSPISRPPLLSPSTITYSSFPCPSFSQLLLLSLYYLLYIYCFISFFLYLCIFLIFFRHNSPSYIL